MLRLILAVMLALGARPAWAQAPTVQAPVITGFTIGTTSQQILGAATSANPRSFALIMVVTPGATIWCTFRGEDAVVGAPGTLAFSGVGSGYQWTPLDTWIPQNVVKCIAGQSGVAVTVITPS